MMKVRLVAYVVSLLMLLVPTAAQQPAYRTEPPAKRPVAKRASLYEKWLETAGGFIVRAPVVRDALTQEVRPWPELGVGIKAAYIRLLDSQMMDVTIYEIPPGRAIKPHHHTYEEYVYVAAGTGYTEFTRAGRVQRLKWSDDAFLAAPFNVTHTHVNTGTSPVRLISITSMPTMVNIGGNAAFTYANNYDFRERYKSQEEYFTDSTKQANRFVTQSFIPNVRAAAVDPYPERGGTNMHWKMSANTMLDAHISEFEVGTYKRAHRHRNEAIIYILNGTGYTLVWQHAGDKPQKIDWQKGSLQQVPPFWYHQHFNTGTEPVRYLAVTSDGVLSNLGLEDSEEQQSGDEDPAIRKLFEEELQKARAARGKQ